MVRVFSRSNVAVVGGFLGIVGAASAQPTWKASVKAHAVADDPPGPQEAPADDSDNAIYHPSAKKRIWLPNPPVIEGFWNNDRWMTPLGTSWHCATSGQTRAEAKAKAGLDNNDDLVAVARAACGTSSTATLGTTAGTTPRAATRGRPCGHHINSVFLGRAPSWMPDWTRGSSMPIPRRGSSSSPLTTRTRSGCPSV